MSRNFIHRNLEHAINLRRNPSKSKSLQTAFDEKRLARIEKAAATIPVFIRLKLDLDAAGQISPYQAETPLLPYDVIVTGLIADKSNYRIVLRQPGNDLPIAITGNKRNLHLNVGDIAGKTPQSEKGQKGIFNLLSPIEILADSRLYFDVYKTVGSEAAETLNITLVGVRVVRNSPLDEETRESVIGAIRRRSTPKTVFIKQEIAFDRAGAGGRVKNVYTPLVEEPILIRGCRSSFTQSLINLGIQGEADWTVNDTPIWALAADEFDESDSYLYLPCSPFLRARNVLEMRLENSINGVNIDALVGELTWICELM